MGGTSGSVRVLDSNSCETLQVLSHDGQLCFFLQHLHCTCGLIVSPGDLVQAIVHEFGRQCFPIYSTHQDSCTTQEGTQIIVAGVSEQGAKTTIRVWTSQLMPAPQSSPSMPSVKIKEFRPVDVTALLFTLHQSC